MNSHYSEHQLPNCADKFLSVSRYWDKTSGLATAKILPGEYYVTDQEEAITTVVASCIALCIRDTTNGTGGMAQLMMPPAEFSDSNLASRSRRSDQEPPLLGVSGINMLVDEILAAGAEPENLECKAYGGALALRGSIDLGQMNCVLMQKALNDKGLELAGQDLGGRFPRKVFYQPATGKIFIKKLYNRHNSTVESREAAYWGQSQLLMQ